MVVSSPEPVPEAALLAETAWLRRLARHMVGEEQADDVVQDACVAALERPPKDPSRLRGWLAQVVRNAARGRLRDRVRRLRREALAARGEAAPAGDDVVARAETQQRVVAAVLSLDEPYRTTILLRFVDDLPPRKVAARMGVPVATVHTRLRRGLDLLRRRIGERGRSWGLVLLPLLAREGKLWTLLAAGGAVMSKKAALVGTAAILALSLGSVVWSSRVSEPDRSRELARAPRGGGGEEAPEPGGDAIVVEGRVRLRGRVVDADGNGVAGARVDVMAEPQDPTHVGQSISRMGPGILDATRAAEQVRRGWALMHEFPVSRGGAACDAEGRFDLVVDPLPGDYLLARAPGFAAATETELCLLRSAAGISIQLKKQVACRVRVVDGSKAPVAGASVTLISRCVLARKQTDALGRADFSDEPRGGSAIVERQGYSTAYGRLHDAREEEVTVELRAAVAIEGVVLRAADRTPVAGAAVFFDFGAELATTDAEGRFSLDRAGLDSSVYKRIVIDAGRTGVGAIVVEQLPPNPLEILLHRTLTLEGRLVGAVPLEGLRVLALQPGLPWRAARADATGAFRIEGAAEDVPVCVLFDPSEPRYEEKGAPPTEARYEPWTGYATFEIVPRAAIEGRVVDETGAPVAGARLELRPRARYVDGVGPLPMFTGDVFTDEDGRFRLEGLSTRPPPARPGAVYAATAVRVAAEGFAWRDEGLPALEPGEERTGFLVRLDRGLSITGRVVTEDGSAVPGARVWVYERAAKQDDERHRGWARVDAEGRYRMDGLPAGDYGVHAVAEEFQRAGHERVPAGTEAPTLVLRRAATIEGIVVDEAERPLEGAYVSARNARAQGSSANRTDAAGRFRIVQLEPGAYDVQASDHGYLGESKASVIAPSSGVRLVLRRGLSIRGSVVGADGASLRGVHVRAERWTWDPAVAGWSGDASTDGGGRFEITGLSAGEFRLTFENQSGDANVLPPLARVAAGSELLVRAEAGRFIEGKVVDREGKLVRVQITAVPLDSDGYAGGTAYSGPDGRYRVGPLKGSRFLLLAGGGPVFGFARDAAAGATDVDVVMGRGEVIAGTVVDKDGKLTPANLTIVDERTRSTRECPTEDGRFRIEGLPSGAYFVTATTRNGAYVYEPWRDTRNRGPTGTKVESGTLDAVLTLK